MKHIALVGTPFALNISDCTVTWLESAEEVSPARWSEWEAVFLTEPENTACLQRWCGHSHLRVCADKATAQAELDAFLREQEYERKFLIEMPDLEALKKYFAVPCRLEQVYLQSHAGTHRIRKRSVCGTVQYFETFKQRITVAKCYESEHIISAERYETLLQQADKQRAPIRKTRHCFIYRAQYFELDVFPFWQDKALLELEQREEGLACSLPPEIRVIKDVTDAPAYKNSYIARKIYENHQAGLL